MKRIFKKGFFTVITTFFLVIVIVFSLLAFIGSSGIIIQLNKETNKNVNYIENAKIFRDRLMVCHGKTVLIEEKLNGGECSDLIEGIKGYKVVQQDTTGCGSKEWIFGDTDEQLGHYVYWVTIQTASTKRCLAKLFIYY